MFFPMQRLGGGEIHYRVRREGGEEFTRHLAFDQVNIFKERGWSGPRLRWWRDSERCWEEIHHSGDWIRLFSFSFLLKLMFKTKLCLKKSCWCVSLNEYYSNNKHFLICRGLSGAGVVSRWSTNYPYLLLRDTLTSEYLLWCWKIKADCWKCRIWLMERV